MRWLIFRDLIWHFLGSRPKKRQYWKLQNTLILNNLRANDPVWIYAFFTLRCSSEALVRKLDSLFILTVGESCTVLACVGLFEHLCWHAYARCARAYTFGQRPNVIANV